MSGTLALERTGIPNCLLLIYNVQPRSPPRRGHMHGQRLLPVVKNILIEQYLHLDLDQ